MIIKTIHWRHDCKPDANGRQFANVHLLIGYNGTSVSGFRRMADILRETFPEATDNDIECGMIQNRDCGYYGFSIVTFNANIDVQRYEGWHEENGCNWEYRWR